MESFVLSLEGFVGGGFFRFGKSLYLKVLIKELRNMQEGDRIGNML